jgi:hypothetical protein
MSICARERILDELYDLASDISETRDLANLRGRETKALGTDVEAWDNTLVPAAFPGLEGRATKTSGKPARRKDVVEP